MLNRTILGALLAIATPVFAASFRATVERVYDGDTIAVHDEIGRSFRIRLSGIDAPELGQAFGDRSRQSLVQLLNAGPVFIDVQGRDEYGRFLGKVVVGFRDAGLAQIEAGSAWAYPWADSISQSDRLLYAREERTARAMRLGLWSDPNPMPPWQYRREERAAGAPPGASVAPRAGPRSGGPVVIIGNRGSKLYHLPHCPSYDAVAPSHRVFFASVEDAERGGYRRARNCR